MKPGMEEKIMSKQRSSEKKCSKGGDVCRNTEKGPVLGDPPVWWRGPGWKSSQATKPSRGPDTVCLDSSISGNMEDRPVVPENVNSSSGNAVGRPVVLENVGSFEQ